MTAVSSLKNSSSDQPAELLRDLQDRADALFAKHGTMQGFFILERVGKGRLTHADALRELFALEAKHPEIDPRIVL